MPRPNDTREKLEIEALRYFARNDYERSSLNDIAEELGVTKGAIYHYFRNKDELFKASVLRLMDSMNTWFIEAMPSDIPFRTLMAGLFNVDEALDSLGTAAGLEKGLFAYENSYYLLLAAMKKFPEIQSTIDDIYAGFRRNMEEVMRNAIATGEIREDTDIVAITYEITAFYEGALLMDAFCRVKHFPILGPRVCDSILKRITTDSEGMKTAKDSGTGVTSKGRPGGKGGARGERNE